MLFRIPRPSPRVPARDSSLHTARVCSPRLACASPAKLCGRKKLPFAGYSVVKERSLKLPNCQLSASSQRRPLARQLLSKHFGVGQERLRSTNRLPPMLRARAYSVQAGLNSKSPSLSVSACERRLENTGLEPVTSWLQTRRSPS